MSATSTSQKNRVLSIDLIRAIAVLLVLGRHTPVLIPRGEGVLNWLHTRWWMGGWAGVDLFFVLSGFLVSGLLFSEAKKYGEVKPGQFLLRRGFKIYPPFYVMMAATVAFTAYQGATLEWSKILAEILYVQNYFERIWNHTWSLAIEEHFYLLLAAVIGVGTWWKKRQDRDAKLDFAWVPAFCLAFMVFAFFGRLALHWVPDLVPANEKLSLDRFYYPTHLRIDSLFFGVLLSWVYHFKRSLFDAMKPFRWHLFFLGFALFSHVFFYNLATSSWMLTYGFTVLYVGSGLITVAMMHMKPSRLLTPLGAIGFYSYSIYLWHMPVAKWVWPELLEFVKKIPGAPYWQTLFFCAISVVVGIVLARLIEIPVLKIRDRLVPSRSAQLKPPGEATPTE